MFNIKREYINCYKDKTRKYFIENYLTTFNADQRKEVPFTLFPRQIELLKSFVNNSNTVAIKHRQAGITTVASGWITGQCVFAKRDSPETVLCIGNKLDISEQLIEKIGAFLDQVPRWMWGADFYSTDPKSEKNSKSIYKIRNQQKIELFNGCKIYARSSGEHASRGISAVSILVFDEAAFIQNGPAVYSSAVAATSSVEDAKIIMISTPNGKDQLYYKTYSQALKGENNFNAVEFKWFQDLRYNRNLKWYRKNEKTGEIEWDIDTRITKRGDIKYDEKRWAELEKKGFTPTSPWFEHMCKSFNNDEQKIAQELLVSFLGSSDNVVPPEIIDMQDKQNTIVVDNDEWQLKDIMVKETWIWKDPIPDHRYIIACDPSSGSGDDRTAIEVIDVDAVDENGVPFFEQVLEYNGKLTGDEVGVLVDRYGRIYNDALAIVETIGGYGDSTVLTLLNLKYPNIYYDEPELKSYTAQNQFSKPVLNDKLPGFRSSNLRIPMIFNLVELIKNNSFRIRSKRVITELETWVFKNGRPDHMDGCHDDTLTCLAMGLFIMQHYMLKTDKLKRKDEYIVKSWFINTNTQNRYNTLNTQQNINLSSPNRTKTMINPFNYYMDKEKTTEDIVNACIMLGGFKIKK